MARRRHEDDDEDGDVDMRDVLKDGERLHVSLFDHAIRQHLKGPDAPRRPRITDAGDSRLGLNRPGYRVADGIRRDQRHYEQYDAELSTSWKSIPPTGVGSSGFVGAQEGDSCTVRNLDFPDDTGAEGTMQFYRGKLTCVPRRRQEDAMPRDAATEYQAYDEWLTNAWRDGR